MTYVMETAYFVAAELMFYCLKNYAEAIVNRYTAVRQMAIETGYQYGMTLDVIHHIWLTLAIAAATTYAITIYIQVKKEREK